MAKIQTELAVGVYAALPGAGMTFPFPQREVRILRDAPDGSAAPAKTPRRTAVAPGRSVSL